MSDHTIAVDGQQAKRTFKKRVVHRIVWVVSIHRVLKLMLLGIQPTLKCPSPFTIMRGLDNRSVRRGNRRTVARTVAVRGVRLYTVDVNPVEVIGMIIEETARGKKFLRRIGHVVGVAKPDARHRSVDQNHRLVALEFLAQGQRISGKVIHCEVSNGVADHVST